MSCFIVGVDAGAEAASKLTVTSGCPLSPLLLRMATAGEESVLGLHRFYLIHCDELPLTSPCLS